MQLRLAMMGICILTSLQVAFVPLAGAVQPGDDRPRDRVTREQEAKQDRADRADRARQERSDRSRQRAAQNRDRRGPPVELESGVIRGAEQRGLRAAGAGQRYIVVLKNGRHDIRSAVADLDGEPGIVPTIVFEHAFTGFASYLTPKAKRALERDPRVQSITEDRQSFLFAQPQPQSQHLPVATDRVDAERNPVARIDGVDQRIDADIAIIDTGVDLNHPDLNVFVYVNCTPSPNHEERFDARGHGTHVAGTAAAKDNNIGTVGVAPGARIWAMRVMDDSGLIWRSYVMACLDLVARYAQVPYNGETIDIINVSLGGDGSDGPCNANAYHLAYCRAVDAGATVVAAAGNDGKNAARVVPAAYDEVITVSALADTDGRPGGAAGSFNPICQVQQTDDGLATFSNFGADVDIAAPGIEVFSTYPTYKTPFCSDELGDGYEIANGTSMASPHVAGAAALIRASHPRSSPAQVKAKLLATREKVAMPGDPDGIDEGILNLDFEDPNLSVMAPNRVRVKRRFHIRVRASDPDGIARVELSLCERGRRRCRRVDADPTAPYRFARRHTEPGRVRYLVRALDKDRDSTDEVERIKIRESREKNRRNRNRRN